MESEHPVQTDRRRQPGRRPPNHYDRREWAGAFGDPGTLIPYLVGYFGVVGVDPFGVLLSFGLAMILCGTWYRTPFPVQPMKAIGALAIARAGHQAAVTPATVHGACLATGLFWLLLGLSGAAGRITALIPRPVVTGIVLGLALSFMREGITMMSGGWPLAAAGLTATLLLLNNRRIPVMFLLLIFGALWGITTDSAAVARLAGTSVELRLPAFTLPGLSWDDLLAGTLLLALPQLPLTLGNAVVAVREENNRLFPDRPVTDRQVTVSTGLMNLTGAALGGVPMCHGAGGMAGHVAFGARTGGAPIILGALLVALALFGSASVTAFFQLFPAALLGVILFITGAQLALGTCRFSSERGELFVTLATAAFALWHIGAAFVIGVGAAFLVRRSWLKP